MIERGKLTCDGCGEPHRCDYDGPGRPDREYLEGRAESAGWLIERTLGVLHRTTPGKHFCRTCRHAVERDSLVVVVTDQAAS